MFFPEKIYKLVTGENYKIDNKHDTVGRLSDTT